MRKSKFISLIIILTLSIVLVNAQESDDVAITLERTPCFGTCPVYTVTILKDGTVNYSGENFVDITGEQTSQIDPETVTLMVQAFEDAGYFEWDEAYDTQTVSDLPSVITSVSHNGETHRIMRYAGDSSAPLALPFLEQWVDIMANTGMWTGHPIDISGNLNNGESPLITLQHEPCFGFCPVYNVALYEDGTVVYMGLANVDNVGVHLLETDAISVTSLAQLAQVFGYFDWEDSYQHQVMTDQATVITSVRWEDNFKRIIRYDGDPNAPIGLLRIEERIDELAMSVMD
jgi:hypothetical protein